MVRIKPSFDGSNEEFKDDGGGSFYDGPPPQPGTYRGIVKRMGLRKIQSGANKGSDQLVVLLEISEGEYAGAGIFTNLNLTQQSSRFVNQFLAALTDGSEEQKQGIKHAFWNVGYEVEKDEVGKMGRPITKIGTKTNPIGMPVSFVTRMGSYNGEPRAEIARFVAPRYTGNGITKDTPLEGLDEFAPVGAEENDPWA